ncbi:MAG: tetratricopeptide repeat protein [Thermodesulfovibrionales bacterium]|jgi:tetratricopeptide (TPR) repeat protein
MGKKKDKKNGRGSRSTPEVPSSAKKHVSDLVPGFTWKHLLIVMIISVGAYCSTLSMDFVWDDMYQIKSNDQIKSLSHIPSFFASDVWAGVKDLSSGYYRPLFTLSLAADYSLWDERPVGYHLTNIALHSAVTAMVYLLSLCILRTVPPALFSAFIFAVHPVHAEAVAWISGRNEMLWSLFMLGSLFLYLLGRERQRMTYIAPSLVLFFLALLSKETAIILPLIVLLYELCYGTGGLQKKMRFPVVYALAVIPYVILRLVFLKGTGLGDVYPLSWRLYTAPGLVMQYLRLLIFPVNLKVFYDIPVKKIFLSPDVIIPLLLLGAILWCIMFVLRYDKRLTFSLLFSLIALIPVAGIFKSLSPALLADRYLYIPSVGFSLALGTVYSIIVQKTEPSPPMKPASAQELFRLRNMVKPGGAFLVGILLILTLQRNHCWTDDAIFTHAMVRDAPRSYFTHFSLGTFLDSQGRLDDAAREFQVAIKLNPDYVDAHNNLGIIYDQRGHLQEALKEYQIVLNIAPGNVKVHNNLGILYEKTGNLDAAQGEYEAALRLDPANVTALTNLGLLDRKRDRPADAMSSFQAALARNQNDPGLHNALGSIYLGQQRFNDAAGEFYAALKLNPDSVEAHTNLGLTFRKMNRLGDAVQEFRTALKLNPRHAEAHNNLGVVYMLLGNVDEAISEFNAALLIAPQNEAFRANLKKAAGRQAKKGS